MLLPGGSCETPGLRADVAVDAALFSVSDDTWRIVARDDAGEKLASAKLKPATTQE